MASNMKPVTRRAMLEKCALVTISAIPLALALRGGPGAAAGVAKADLQYQDHPNDGGRCANCVAYVPPADGTANGTCRIVDGPISPDGWCIAFSPKLR